MLLCRYLLKSNLAYWHFISCPLCLQYWCKKYIYSYVEHLFNLQHNYNYFLIMKFIPDPAPFIIFLLLWCFCFIVPSNIHSFVLFFLYVYNCFKHWKAIVEDKEKKNQYSKFKVYFCYGKSMFIKIVIEREIPFSNLSYIFLNPNIFFQFEF